MTINSRSRRPAALRAMTIASAVGLSATCATAPAQTLFEPTQPGSLLVYPLFDVNNAAGTAKSTTIKIANLGNTTIWVHFVRVCGSEISFSPTGEPQGICQASDRVAKLTQRETFVRDVAAYFGVDRTNCPTGFIVAYLQRGQFDRQPVVGNVLVGSTHINGAGPLNQRTSAVPAYGFQAFGQPGANVAGSIGGLNPVLPLDGVGYAAPPTTLHTDFLATAGTRFSELSLLTLDVQASATNPVTLVGIDWNNQGEEPFSGALEYVCHVRVRLDDEVNAVQPGAGMQGGNNFQAANLGSAYGVMTINPGTPDHAVLGTITEAGQNRLTHRQLFYEGPARPTSFISR